MNFAKLLQKWIADQTSFRTYDKKKHVEKGEGKKDHN